VTRYIFLMLIWCISFCGYAQEGSLRYIKEIKRPFLSYRRYYHPLKVLVALSPQSMTTIAQTFSGSTKKTSDDDYEELFALLFKKKSEFNKEQRAYVSLTVHRRSLGDHEVFIMPMSNEVRLSSSILIPFLRKIAKESTVQLVESLAKDDDTLTLSDLKGKGVEAFFLPQKMEVVISLPPHMLKTQTYLLDEVRPFSLHDDVVRHAPVAAYVNIHAGYDLIHNYSDADPSTLYCGVSGNVNYNDWVLEAYGSYRESLTPRFSRDDIRIVRKDPERAIGYSFGDINVSTKGFQVGRKMLGASVTRDFDLQPYTVTEPTTNYMFLLRAPATVEIWINDFLVKTMHLDPGEHDIRNFPLDHGNNDITIRIIDIYGKERVIAFPFIKEPSLLAKGASSFSYNIGFAEIDSSPRRYDVQKPTFSCFHRQGLTDKHTFGVNLQCDTDHAVGGVEGAYAQELGAWYYGTSSSYLYGEKRSGIAAEVGFRSYDDNSEEKVGRRPFRYSLHGEYFSSHFAFLGDSPYDQRTRWDVTASARKQIATGLSM
jgi:outer membrane usher protein